LLSFINEQCHLSQPQNVAIVVVVVVVVDVIVVDVVVVYVVVVVL